MLVLFVLIAMLVVCNAGSKAPRMSDEAMYQQLVHFLEMTQGSEDASTTAIRTSILDSQLYNTLHAQFGSTKK
jgi:hypothetical protein